jgi:hypothetical protein
MFKWLKNSVKSVIDILSVECALCSSPCKYEKDEQKNFISLEQDKESLICKECAQFLQTVDDIKKRWQKPF